MLPQELALDEQPVGEEREDQRELDEEDDVDALERREQAALARRVVLREMGVMTVDALLILTLSLRAASTSGGL